MMPDSIAHAISALLILLGSLAAPGNVQTAMHSAEKGSPRVAVASTDPSAVARGQVVMAAADTPVEPPVKRIEVILATQHLIGWEGNTAAFEFAVTTGQDGQQTMPGEFEILDKEENPYSYAWGFDMPYWMGIYQYGDYENGFHALPINANGDEIWGEALGEYPVTHGCIVLSHEDAARLYAWADVGTKVDIHD